MRSEIKIDDATVAPIVEKLLSQEREETLDSFRTDTRTEYDILLSAAQKGKFPDLLSMTHRGLRLKKRFVHAPVSSASAA